MSTATAPQAASPSLADGVAEIFDGRQRAEADQRRATEATYVALILRNADPQPGDAEALADAMAELDVSREQLAEDARHVGRARHLADLADQRSAAGPASVKAREHLAATVKRCHAEIDTARHASHSAEGRLSQCSTAGDELVQLARRRPLLFDTATDPPRLRTSA